MTFPLWLVVPSTNLLPRHGTVRTHRIVDDLEPVPAGQGKRGNGVTRPVDSTTPMLPCAGEGGCGDTKPTTDFYTYRIRARKDGTPGEVRYRNVCKVCYTRLYNLARPSR